MNYYLFCVAMVNIGWHSSPYSCETTTRAALIDELPLTRLASGWGLRPSSDHKNGHSAKLSGKIELHCQRLSFGSNGKKMGLYQ